MDFFRIKTRGLRRGVTEIYPEFIVGRSKDLMVRGKSFYAVWDENKGIWSTDEYDIQKIVDKELQSAADKYDGEDTLVVKFTQDFSSNSWTSFKKYTNQISDNSHQLDEKVTFLNTKVSKKDYVSKRLSYNLERGDYSAWDELVGTLYSESEREKIEWAIGSIIAGDSKKIQKFVVLYGDPGAGKGTILEIIKQLFEGYYAIFDAGALTTFSNQFSTESLKGNPLIGIQSDSDLSRIENNTLLNSIVSHEEIIINEKHKSTYSMRMNCFLFLASNKPVKITDGKSGIIRRLIDISPTGNLIKPRKYSALKEKIGFELGAIAQHCLEVYRGLGANYYDGYRPTDMIMKTDVFYNFVDDSFFVFKEQNGTTLKAAYAMYKEYCDNGGSDFKMPMYKFREELKNYFDNFEPMARIDGKQLRSYYSGFKVDKFQTNYREEAERPPALDPDDEKQTWIHLEKQESLLDQLYSECPAQYATPDETPSMKWSDVKTKLKDLDTSKVHYVKPPDIHHIVFDYDKKDEKGNKSLALNIEAASKMPATYAELSKGGEGLHLHYLYSGDPNELSRVFEPEVEIKVFAGNSSLRRRLSKCNNIPMATLSSGLPLKEEKVVNFDAIKNEEHLRALIKKNLRKEIANSTAVSINYIQADLEKAYASGMHYDVSDMRPAILAFANRSTHQAENCKKKVIDMKFKSDEPSDPSVDYKDDRLVFFDIEVFPNLLLVNWKYEGPDQTCIRMINPTPADIEELIRKKLIGFNCRRYDNHILYARMLGKNNQELYNISQRIINGSDNAFFSEAYSLSYTDVYDFSASTNKQSLKQWEIDLDIHHKELGLPWDQPVPEEKWQLVAEYCDNDVIATEAVFHHLRSDWIAREILADISGLTVNDTTNRQSEKIIFGNDPHPQKEFVYTDLSKMFPGYKFNKYGIDKSLYKGKIKSGKSIYKGEDPSEGGRVYAKPGIYRNIALLDIASMHPSSIEALNLFGDRYTKKFSEIKQARIYIKHGEFDKLKTMFDGKLAKYLDDPHMAKDLSTALKTVINSVYGLTSAKFENKFRDPRNEDNIVAKRGALFMIDLQEAVEKLGYEVVHIKTDSIKIANADPSIISFVMDFGKKYQYTFEHEATYDRMCIVNDAVYIAKYDHEGLRGENDESRKHRDEWTATGAQFAQPYVFKTLFSKEKIEFKDCCETKSVSTALYLDMNENLPDVTPYEDELKKLLKKDPESPRIKELEQLISAGHNYVFVGKVGSFCPILDGCDGGRLVREKDGKFDSANGGTGTRWLEAEVVKNLKLEDQINHGYFRKLVDAAVKDISAYGDFEMFVNGDSMPWTLPCGKTEYEDCSSCPSCKFDANQVPSCVKGFDIRKAIKVY